MIADIIFSLVLIVISIAWIVEGISLGLWIPGVSAGSGFVPAVFAALTLVSSLVVIYQAWKKHGAAARKTEGQEAEKPEAAEPEAEKVELEEPPKTRLAKLGTIVPVLFCIGAIVSLQLFGLVITVFAISFLWLMFVSDQGLKKSLLVGFLITLFIYMVFEFWLKIPFPGDIIRL